MVKRGCGQFTNGLIPGFRRMGKKGGRMTKDWQSTDDPRWAAKNKMPELSYTLEAMRERGAKGIPAPYMGRGRRGCGRGRRGRGWGSFLSSVGKHVGNAAKWVANNPDKIIKGIDTGLNLATAANQKYLQAKDTINAIRDTHRKPAAEAVMKESMYAKPKPGKPRPRPGKPRKAGSVSANKRYNKIIGGYIRGAIP